MDQTSYPRPDQMDVTLRIYIFQHCNRGIYGSGLAFSCCLGVSMETTLIGMLKHAVLLGFSLCKSRRM